MTPMEVEIFTRDGWVKKSVEGRVVSRHLVTGGSIYSPRFWKPAGEHRSGPFIRKFNEKSCFMGPFEAKDEDLAKELSAKYNRKLKKARGKWFIQ